MQTQRLVSSIAAVVLVAATWLIVLPWLADRPGIRRHVDHLHASDVNASAMFYSELDCQYMLVK